MSDLSCDRFEGSLHGKMCVAMFVSGLSRLGGNTLMSVEIIGSGVISSWVVMAL